MRIGLSPGAFGAWCGIVMAATQSAQGQACNVLTPEKISALSHYVELKYNLPFNATAAQSDISFVKDTCFRKLRFTSASGRPQDFSLSLYLSPDQRFLTKDLLDSTQNPLLEQQERKNAVLGSLLRTPAPSLGEPDAPITVTVFSDFQCPYCRQQAKILREENSLTDPRVRIVFRNLPLSIHPWSRRAADAAACAAVQSSDAFWAVHDFLFQHQSELTVNNIGPELRSYVQSANTIDATKFSECVRKDGAAKLVDSDLALARENEVNSTPTLFVNGLRINGIASSEQLQTLIRELASPKPSFSPPPRQE